MEKRKLIFWSPVSCRWRQRCQWEPIMWVLTLNFSIRENSVTDSLEETSRFLGKHWSVTYQRAILLRISAMWTHRAFSTVALRTKPPWRDGDGLYTCLLQLHFVCRDNEMRLLCIALAEPEQSTAQKDTMEHCDYTWVYTGQQHYGRKRKWGCPCSGIEGSKSSSQQELPLL